MSKIAQTFPVVVGEEEIHMVANARSILAINRQFGGIGPALQKVREMDMEAIAFIIATAGGVTKKQDREEVVENVVTGGIEPVLGPVIEYLVYVINGCRTPDEVAEAEAAKAGKPKGRAKAEA